MNCHISVLTLMMFVLAAGPTSASPENMDTFSSPPTRAFCPDLKPQSSLDLEQITGKWYVVEVIRHKVDPLRPTVREVVLETCPTVKVRLTSPRSLGLLWTEKAGTLDYSLSIPDLSRAPGFWKSRELQNGSLVSANYVHFTGTVQVMKAVNSHMVLTFCYETPDNQMYSILLAREHHLPESDAEGVRSMLNIRGVSIISVQKSCVNAGSSVSAWGMMVLIATLATITLTAIETGFGI